MYKFVCVFALLAYAVTPVAAQTVTLPGTIEAENFDEGAAGVAYVDSTSGNAGGQYRSTDVDIETAADLGGGYNIGWFMAGEWMNYSVNVAAAGTYDIELRVASNGPGGTFHIEINGVDRTGSVTIPDTFGWQSWISIRKTGLTLEAGPQVWRIVGDSTGAAGAVGNFNFVRVTAPPQAGEAPDIVLDAAEVTATSGNWVRAGSSGAAGGEAMQSHDLGAGATVEPLAEPTDYFEAEFRPQTNTAYRLWLRLRANADTKYNDSVWVQFSGAVDANAAPLWRIGTTAGLLVNLERCSGCGVAGWGWQNHAWWLSDDAIVRFPAEGPHRIRIQRREDGVEVDQIVLSTATYFHAPPGAQTNDTTIVPKPSDGQVVSNQPPGVTLTSPADGATYTAPASITLTASPTDTDGTIARVDFFAGTQLVGSATASPWSVTWSDVAAGSYTLTAVAHDDDGATATSAALTVTVNAPPNQAPSVALTSPPNGATYTAPASITLTALPTDTDGTIARVDFFAGTQLVGSATASPWSVTWSDVAAGTYTLTAVAHDDEGATTTSTTVTVTVNVAPNQPPTVALTSPASGATYTAPAAIALTANPADSDGTIGRVDFFAGAQLVGSATASPWSVTWSDAPAGTFALTAVAHDDEGATTTSTTVTVTVNAAPPPPIATTLVFTASADHDSEMVTAYAVAIYREGDDPATGEPVATQSLGKPAPSNGDITTDVSNLVDPLPNGSYYAVVMASGPGGSAPSAPSTTFVK